LAWLLVAIGAFDAFMVARPLISGGWSYSRGMRGSPYAYDWVLLLLFVPYAYALHAYRRSRPAPSLRAVLLGSTAVSLPLVFALPTQSHDVYQYIFYARMQLEHGANPYVVAPITFANDIGFQYIGWPHQVSVYGPLWSLAVTGTALVVRDHLLASLFAVKGMVVALEAIAVWGLLRIEPTPGATAERAVWVLAFALNPLVVSTLALGGHADAALAAGFVWAVVWDRRDRPLAAGLLLAATSLVKAYAALPLAIYALAVWRRGRRREALLIVGGAAALAGLLYLPYWDGPATVRGLLSVGSLRSSSLAGTVQGWIEQALRAVGAPDPGRAAALATHLAALLVLAVVAVLLARSPRTVREPWRASVLMLATFLLVTPWSLPWYAVGLLALAVPLADEALSDAVLTFSATCLAPGSVLAGSVRTALRYGTPTAVFAFKRRAARTDPVVPSLPAPAVRV
jgi:hypothetical protein